jgi:hypothetical protein
MCFVRSLTTVALVFALCLVLTGCGGSKLTLANYERVQPGMSVREVERILGKGREQASSQVPSFSVGGYSSPAISGKVLTWQEGQKTVCITFTNDQVSVKAQFGL